MSAFTVTVRTQSGETFNFRAIGKSCIDVHIEVIKEFGICAATVKPAVEA